MNNDKSTNSYEAMKAELEAAGYAFLPEHFEGMSFDDFTGWVQAPDGTWIEGESFSYKLRVEADIARYQADKSCIDKAWKHYQREKQFEVMQKTNGIMRDRLEYIRAIASDSARDGSLSESDLRARLLHISERAAKALLATIAKDESMKG